MRTNEINVEVNALTVANSLKELLGIKHSEALNQLARWAGFGDFGALKAAIEKKSTKATAQDQVFARINFITVAGGFEEYRERKFERQSEESIEEFTNRMYSYALFCYEDIGDYILEEYQVEIETMMQNKGGQESEYIQEFLGKASQNAIEKYKEEGRFESAGGDILIRKIYITFLSEDEFSAS